jgi:hypothetical protein
LVYSEVGSLDGRLFTLLGTRQAKRIHLDRSAYRTSRIRIEDGIGQEAAYPTPYYCGGDVGSGNPYHGLLILALGPFLYTVLAKWLLVV